MRKLALVVVFLAACGRKHPAPGAGLTIAITHDGFVKVEGKAVTLDELGAVLARTVDRCCFLDIADDVPWGHVSLVVWIAAEQRLVKLVFPGEREWTVPRTHPPHSGDEPERVALQARVLVLDDGRYAVDERSTSDIGDIRAWIEAAPMAFLEARIGIIRAQSRAPWRSMAPVLDLFRELGMARVDLYGTTPPTAEERRCTSLPDPPPGPRPRAWPGLVEVAYWPKIRYCDIRALLEPREVLRHAIDENRLGFGLGSLGYDDALGNAASLHALEMRRLGYFGHFSPVPGNHGPSERLAKVGWPEERPHAELLAKAETWEGAYTAIARRPENAKLLADPAFKYAGVARCGDSWVVLLGAGP